MYPEAMPDEDDREVNFNKGSNAGDSPQDGSQSEKEDQLKDLSKVDRVRTEFPETWLWSEVISGYLMVINFVALSVIHIL